MDSAYGLGDMAISGSFLITDTLVPNQTIASELLGTFSPYIPATSSMGFYLYKIEVGLWIVCRHIFSNPILYNELIR